MNHDRNTQSKNGSGKTSGGKELLGAILKIEKSLWYSELFFPPTRKTPVDSAAI